MKEVTVQVPATTANIGPGFDCLGAALSLYNRFKFTLAENNSIELSGTQAQGVFLDLSPNNLLYHSFLRLYQHIDHFAPTVKMSVEINVPLSRGLGSSATAIVGGLLAANAMAGNRLTKKEIRNLAISIEGHPDNVVPALLGNCQLSVGGPGNWQISQIQWHSDVVAILAIPDFKLSTEKARAVLPNQYSRQDAIFNMSHLALLIKGLETGNPKWLKESLQDRLHQPYRQSLIPGYDAVYGAAMDAKAHGLVISGAGPTLLALSAPDCSDGVSKAIEQAWQIHGVKAEVMTLAIAPEGAMIES